MVTLRNVILENFLSHERTSVDFEENDRLLIDGASGSGKSSIVDAIIWALYGVGRVDNRSLVRRGQKAGGVAVVVLDDEKKAFFRIVRKVTSGGKHSVDVFESPDGTTWLPLGATGVKETQRWIGEQLLHCSYELFINSVAYPQNSQDSFVLASNSRRKELLLEIINVGNLDEYYERARKQLAERQLDVSRIEGEYEANERSITAVQPLAEALKERESKRNAARAAEAVAREDVDAARVERDTVRSTAETAMRARVDKDAKEHTLKKTKSDIETLQRHIASVRGGRSTAVIQAEIDELLPVEETAKELEADRNNAIQIERRRAYVMSQRPTVRDYVAELVSYERRLERMDKETPTCPSGDECPFFQSLEPERAALVEAIQGLKSKHAAQEKDIEAWQQSVAELEESHLTDINGRLEAIAPELRKLEALRKEHAAAVQAVTTVASEETRIKVLEADVVRLEGEIGSLDELLAVYEKDGAEERLRKATERLSEAEGVLLAAGDLVRAAEVDVSMSLTAADELVRLNERQGALKAERKRLGGDEIPKLQMIKEAFGSNGIKALAVDFMIPRLEDKINEVLSQMSDFRVQLDTQRSSASTDGKIEGLFITIRNELGEEFDFASYSGGERLKIMVAISEALASLQKIGFRILDELFVGLDEESTESFAHVLAQVQSRFSQMICISHLRSIKDLFERKITATKRLGVTTIV